MLCGVLTDCPRGWFTCTSGQCVLSSERCDGTTQCANGNDEFSTACGKTMLRSISTISWLLECDNSLSSNHYRHCSISIMLDYNANQTKLACLADKILLTGSNSSTSQSASQHNSSAPSDLRRPENIPLLYDNYTFVDNNAQFITVLLNALSGNC